MRGFKKFFICVISFGITVTTGIQNTFLNQMIVARAVEIFKNEENGEIELVRTDNASYTVVNQTADNYYELELIYCRGLSKDNILSTLDSFDSEGSHFKVVKIGNEVFRCRDLPPEITIPDTISSIDQGAFCECNSLEKINFTSNLNEIGSYAFCNCENLKELNNFGSIEIGKIQDGCFMGCSKLERIDLSLSKELGEDIVDSTCKIVGREFIPKNMNWGFISEKLSDFQDKVVKKAKESKESLQNLKVTDIYKFSHILNGYSDLPSVVKEKDFRELSNKKIILYRGISPFEKTADEYIKEFKSGEYFGSKEGSGTFSSSALAGAKNYAIPCTKKGKNKGIGKVVKFCLKDESKIVSNSFLEKIYLRHKYQNRCYLNEGFKFEKFLDTVFVCAPAIQAVFAEALGMDAICSENPEATYKEAKTLARNYRIKVLDESEYVGKQYIILNRKSLIIQEEDIVVEIE